MQTDLDRAKQTLTRGGHTAVLCREDTVYITDERGVKPLLDWIAAGTDLAGFSAADKAVGKAAALLYVLLGVRAVYAPLMSEPARRVLEDHGITAGWEQLVPAIRNRSGDGLCPMEQAVWEIEEPETALAAIRAKIAQMMAAQS